MSEFSIFLASLILLGIFVVFCVSVDLASVVRKRRLIKPVEFFAPKGFSPIDVALTYSARRVKANALFTPLLLYWADQGYVTVEEDGRGLKITKQKWLPPFEESGRADRDTYDCELTLFREMFAGHDAFYTLAAPKSVNDTYDETMNECKKISRDVVGKKGKWFSLAMKIAAAVVLLIIGLIMSLYTKVPVALVMVFPLIGAFLIKFMPAPFYIRVPFMLVWGGVPLVAALFLIPLPTTFRIVLGLAVLALLLTVFVFAEQADFRDEEALKDYAKVCSFKQFLTVADKNRLEKLVEEFPDYFYDVLPYFYVFGITKKMKKKFDRIIPDGSLRILGPIRDIYID
ncbi:MAG: DUF2207 domain-containing protein [Clostridia bacterium]|nr:DUF2207 domain-containing protein [Clostridia bacterium]